MQSLQIPTAWRLQDAKAQFSSVVEFALQGVPQHVTRRGKQAVVVVSEQDYIALQRNALVASPSFVDHLLAIPKSKTKSAKASLLAVERQTLKLREVDLT
jgi:antitoxin Phd